MTLRDARQRFFAANGFGADGGYDASWQHAKFGAVSYAVPNPPARARALRVHDLHHLVTGYSTDWSGESEISAWELGSGGAGRFGYAWMVALFGFFVGLIALPRATWRAFVRGRGGLNLYALGDIDPWLDRPLTFARRALRVGDGTRTPTPGDRIAFALWAAVAVPVGAVLSLGALPLIAGAWLCSGTGCSWSTNAAAR